MRLSVAILTSRFPYPLIKGDKLRIYHQIKELSRHFDVHLLSINDDYPQEEDYQVMMKYCKSITLYLLRRALSRANIIAHLFSKIPLQVRYFYDRHIHDEIRAKLQLLRPDHIHVHLIRMAPYSQDLGLDIPMSIDYMDSMVLNDLAGQHLNQGLLKWLRARERTRVEAYELEVFNDYVSRYIISKRDRQQFPKAKRPSLEILSNGVDTDYFEAKMSSSTPLYDLIFCGNLSYQPNIEAVGFLVNDIMPKLQNVTCLVAGATPDQRIKKIANSSIEIQGYQEDIRSVYYQGRMMVVPIFTGSGQQNKVLEAMACGTPCIVTSFVNQAIQATPNKEVLISDDAATFVEHIKRLLSRPEELRSLIEAGRLFVEREYSWEANTEILIQSINGSHHE